MQELIEKINERKIKLWIGLDGELHYRAPKGALSSGLAGEIRQNKVKIVEFLKRKVCERIVEVAERNDKIRVAEAKWGEEGLLLQVEPELIRQNYKIYNLAFLNEKMSEIWKSENADIDATVLKQWIETAERVALGEMWKVMLEHDFFVAEGQHFTVEEMESKIGVADKYKRFFRRWLKIFENENFIKEEQDGFCRTSKSWKVDVAAEWDYLWGVEKQLNYGEGLKDINVTACVESIINQIGETDEKLTLVFHSMAGIFIYDTYKKIGKEQIESIYCVACCIPAAGETMSDILKGPLHSFASFCAGKIQVVKRFPKILALAIFGNGMNKKQREKLYSSLCGESTNLLFERINECKLETSIKWILPTKDRALNPKQQRVYMNNIGNIKSIIKLTAPHDVMISHPEEVAKILLEN